MASQARITDSESPNWKPNEKIQTLGYSMAEPPLGP